MNLGGSGTPTSPTTYAVTFGGSIVGGSGRFGGASGTLGGPGTVNLAELTVAATLAGTIKTRGSMTTERAGAEDPVTRTTTH